jgi:hypothetical protein
MKKTSLLLIGSSLIVVLAVVHADEKKVKPDCTCHGMKLWGKVQFVNSFPDLKVKAVDAFPDLKVKMVDAFAVAARGGLASSGAASPTTARNAQRPCCWRRMGSAAWGPRIAHNSSPRHVFSGTI